MGISCGRHSAENPGGRKRPVPACSDKRRRSLMRVSEKRSESEGPCTGLGRAHRRPFDTLCTTDHVFRQEAAISVIACRHSSESLYVGPSTYRIDGRRMRAWAEDEECLALSAGVRALTRPLNTSYFNKSDAGMSINDAARARRPELVFPFEEDANRGDARNRHESC